MSQSLSTAFGARRKLAAGFAALGIALRAWCGEPLPLHLVDTGLYEADGSSLHRDVLPFSPQYPLWSDGAGKRRWIRLPPGGAIDASNPDGWVFPPGTRLWKEFSLGRPIETRYIERSADGSWRYAAYVWNEDGRDAVLAPAEGIAALAAPGGRYAIPAEDDCRACHEGAAVPVLGFSALQLSSDRDPLAAHAGAVTGREPDLKALVERGLVRNLPPALLETPPRIAAPTAVARAALGYLHGNCAHCHNSTGPLAPLDLTLAQGVGAAPDVLDSLIGHASGFRTAPLDLRAQRIVPGQPDRSVLVQRMRSRNPIAQMPPLGTRLADDEGLALVEQWIRLDLPTSPEHHP